MFERVLHPRAPGVTAYRFNTDRNRWEFWLSNAARWTASSLPTWVSGWANNSRTATVKYADTWAEPTDAT